MATFIFLKKISGICTILRNKSFPKSTTEGGKGKRCVEFNSDSAVPS